MTLRSVDGGDDGGVEPVSFESREHVLDEKYIAFKRETGPNGEVVVGEPVMGGFFLIREQDVFAPQACFGYAHTIQSALELNSLPGRQMFSDEEVERLASLADRLTTLALRWQRTPKKVPD